MADLGMSNIPREPTIQDVLEVLNRIEAKLLTEDQLNRAIDMKMDTLNVITAIDVPNLGRQLKAKLREAIDETR